MHLKKEELPAFRIFCIFLEILSLWFFNLLGQSIKIPFDFFNAFDSLSGIYNNLSVLIKTTPLHLSLTTTTLISMAAGTVIVVLVYIYYSYDAKNTKEGEEYGSARWGEQNDIKPFIDKTYKNNIILTQTESLTMSSRMKDPKNNRNKNIIVIGGSGSGKTRFFVKPNIMQMHSNYVVTDPKGSVMEECGKLLLDNGYDVRILNLKDFKKSLHYNPFAYIREDRANADISKFVTTLIENTSGKDAKEDFWVNAEKMLLTALVGFIYYSPKIQKNEKNFRTLCKMFNLMKASEVGDNSPDAVDILFRDMEEEQGDIFPVRVYKKYKKSSGNSGASVLMCVATRLSVFETDEVLELTEFDELDFASMNDQKVALFVVTDDTDNTFGFLAAMMYSQLFNTLCNIADNNKKHRLDIPLRCIMDEFANLGKIPNIEILISTIRSRDISLNIILQSISQLNSLYEKKAQGIVSNCDTFLFLGGDGDDDTKMVSEKLGKQTIDMITFNESKGQNGSLTKNSSKVGLELMAKNEIGLLDGGKCMLFLRGVPPFKSEKFDITKHKEYKYLSDYDDNNFCSFELLKATRDNIIYSKQAEKVIKTAEEFDVTDVVSA